MAAATDRQAILHGTAVSLGDNAALIRGPSGSGKSDLALRCIMMAPSMHLPLPLDLVADDQAVVTGSPEALEIAPPPALAGLIEVRGVGITRVAHRPHAHLTLIVDLVPAHAIERLPDPWPYDIILGHKLPVMKVAPFQSSAPLKIALTLLHRPWTTEDR